MKRCALLASLAAASLLGTRIALAGPAAGVRRVALLLSGNACDSHPESALQVFKELAKLGHVEGRNLTVEWHCFAEEFSRGEQIAAELVRRGVDVFYTGGTPATRILQEATKTIPILTTLADPVASGFTRSLVRPDFNITGYSYLRPETPAKQIELIRLIVPKLDRLVCIDDVNYPGTRELYRPYETAARAAGIVPVMKIVDRSEFERIFREMNGSRTQAAFISFLYADKAEVARLALRHGVATMYYANGYVEVGGLMSFQMYHADRVSREVAIFDKLLRGVKPADIPWELPDRSHFAINLRTAKALGLAVPSDALLRADQIVE